MEVVLEASAVLQFAASTNETKRTARKAGTHQAALTVFRVMSADDQVHQGPAYMHTDELLDAESRRVDDSLHTH